jgi:hypothetical protein
LPHDLIGRRPRKKWFDLTRGLSRERSSVGEGETIGEDQLTGVEQGC